MTQDPTKLQNNKALIGSLSTYLRHAAKITVANPDSHTPCGSCDACCHSVFSKISLTPEEQTRFGVEYFDMTEKGHCPYLSDKGCEIYPTRPLTCRMFDCRYLAACEVSRTETDNIPPLPNVKLKTLADKWAFKPLSNEDKFAAKAWSNAINWGHNSLVKEGAEIDIMAVIGRALSQYHEALKTTKK